MASKKYAFYHKGNKLALTQQQEGGSLTFTDANGNIITRGSSTSDVSNKYKSPITDVDYGLEIAYSYAPLWNDNIAVSGLQSGGTIASGYEYFGWSALGGNLTFHLDPDFNTGSSSYDEELSGASATEKDASYILIKGPTIWAGIHKLKERKTKGRIVTHTKVHLDTRERFSSAEVTVRNIDDAAGNDTILEETTGNGAFVRMFPNIGSTYYFQGNEGGDAENDSIIYECQRLNNNQLSIVANWDFATFTTSAGGWTRSTPTNTIPTDFTGSPEDWTISQIFRDDKCLLFGQSYFSVLEDESFELDLNRTQSDALIYYVKAKLAEDMNDFEKREYFMRLFKKALGKSKGNKSPGVHLAQGHWNMK